VVDACLEQIDVRIVTAVTRRAVWHHMGPWSSTTGVGAGLAAMCADPPPEESGGVGLESGHSGRTAGVDAIGGERFVNGCHDQRWRPSTRRVRQRAPSQILPECAAGALVGSLYAAQQLFPLALEDLFGVLRGDKPELVELRRPQAACVVL
jgi:hypothetical protein